MTTKQKAQLYAPNQMLETDQTKEICSECKEHINYHLLS